MNKIISLFFLIILSIIFKSCSEKNLQIKQMESYFLNGDFMEARGIINNLKSSNGTSLQKEIEITEAKMERIELDFSKNEEDIIRSLKPYFPQLTAEQLRRWENDKKLEMLLIDGERRYFKNAVNNLFRLDSLAKKTKEEKDGKYTDQLSGFCLHHTEEIIRNATYSTHYLGTPKIFKVDFTISLKADVIPTGEIVKCWMPFPRESLPRQKNINLLKVNSADYYLAGNAALQRSLYIEKTTVKGKPTIFNYSAEFETCSQSFNVQQENIIPYKTSSEEYIKYTSQRKPHLLFSDEIKELTAEITLGISNPLEKVKAIYYWIDKNITWASALEYSTFECIPEYVLETRHGDCGMQTLLFMSMARSAGIPCKWQSGWMLHPGEVNLHDWCEVFYEGVGWVPLDMSFGLQNTENKEHREFYISGMDAYRLIINDDFSSEFDPKKNYFRSEPIDFQRGELEWNGGNIYFNHWGYHIDVSILK